MIHTPAELQFQGGEKAREGERRRESEFSEGSSRIGIAFSTTVTTTTMPPFETTITNVVACFQMKWKSERKEG